MVKGQTNSAGQVFRTKQMGPRQTCASFQELPLAIRSRFAPSVVVVMLCSTYIFVDYGLKRAEFDVSTDVCPDFKEKQMQLHRTLHFRSQPGGERIVDVYEETSL